MSEQFQEDCPHITQSKLLSIEDFTKIPFAEMKCENCEEEEDIFICLSCGKAYCSSTKNSHYIEHYKTNPEHCICLGIIDLNIWCHECLDKKGSFIKSVKTEEYIKIYKDYKSKEEKENIVYNETYQNEIKEKKSEDDLCHHIKNMTKDDWEKSPIIKGINSYLKKSEIIFDILCFSCNEKLHTYRKLKSHNKSKNHNIYLDLNEVNIICMECKLKFNINLIKDKLSVEQKISIQKILDTFPLRPKFLTIEERFDIKYNKFANDFTSGKYKKIIFMVGAGISTSAGIPDFRSDTGLFKQLQEKYNLSGPEEFFYKTTFLKNPMFFYEFTKLFDLSQTKPTIAHKFMNFMTHKNYVKYVFTQNIDGLESKAKIPEKKLIYAHGNFNHGHCAKCYKNIDIKLINEGIEKGEVVYCQQPNCNGPCKPRIVFYGENLPKRFYECLEDIKDIDLIIIMGTSLKVYPFAGIPEYAKENVKIVVFNMEKVGNYSYNKIDSNELFIKGKTDENILKFLKDVNMYDEFEKFIKDEYGEELKDIIGKDIKLMNVKELENKKNIDKLSKEIEKMNLNKDEKDEDDDLK